MAHKLEYTPLERLKVDKPVDRIAYLRACCVGKSVLDLGALDETAFNCKRGNGTWVHEEVARVADRVLGLDSSDKVPPEGLPTGRNSLIVKGTVQELPGILRERDYEPDVIIAGELIEHLDNPQGFLSSLRQDQLIGKELLITTPNATALHNILVGIVSRESTHPDHVCILSFKTLNTLFMRADFSDWSIIPYYARFTEMRARSEGLMKRVVDISEKMVNAGEWLCPLLSFGWIARVKI